jgi:hypothetical protein
VRGISGKRGNMIGLAIGLVAIAAVPLTGAQAAAKHCTQFKTLAIDSFARVYGKLNDRAFVCVKSTGSTRRLKGASASGDHFALAGKWVAWTSSASSTPHSVVNVMHIPDGAIPAQFPFNTNDNVNKVVVKSDGASAWAATPSDYPNTLRYVQGMDRSNHTPDSLSDDTKDVKPGSLQSPSGHKIRWRYTDGSIGTAKLF